MIFIYFKYCASKL